MNRFVSLWITLFSASLLLWLPLPQLYSSSPLFGDFLTVATDLSHEDALARLETAGVRGVIAPHTALVHLSRFRDVELVTLAEADAALDPLDPRRDPYLAELGRYFSDGDRALLYLPLGSLSERPLQARRQVYELLGSGSYIVENGGADVVFALLLLAAVVALRAFRTPVWFRRAFLPALPWIPAIVAHGLVAAVPAIALLLYSPFVARLARPRGSQDARGPFLAVLLVAVSIAYAVVLSGATVIIPLVVALAGSAAIRLVPEPMYSFAVDPEHTPFEPVQLMEGARVSGGLTRIRLAAIALLLVVAPLVVDSIAGTTGDARPVPTVRGDLTGESIALLSGAGGLPNLADYLSHRAYQEGFAYGRAYGPPALGETVDLARVIERDDGSYDTEFEPVVTFDASWFESGLGDPPAGIASILSSIGGAASVEFERQSPLYSGILPTSIHLLATIAVLLPAATLLLGRPRVKRRDPIVELARRGRQVA